MTDIKDRIRGFIRSVTPNDLLFKLKKIHYVRALQRFSENDLKIVRLLVKPGQHVIDIGAHVGWYTKVLSELVGGHGRVYSIEPIVSTFDLLSFCIKKLKLMNVELINCAISDEDGFASMEIPYYPSGGENFYRARRVSSESGENTLRRFRVDQKAIDSIFVGVRNKISFVKCDVEGDEWSVVRGARRLIKESRPAWLVEVTGDPDIPNSDASMLMNYLSKEGYRAYWYDGRILRGRSRGDQSVNYFFLTPAHLKDLKASGLAGSSYD